MIAARTVLTGAFTHRIPAGVPPQGPTLPSEMERALVDFGLMPAFRARPLEQRREYARRITDSPTEHSRREHIAGLLDELAAGNRAYTHVSGWQA
jgi:hypothetical protein